MRRETPHCSAPSVPPVTTAVTSATKSKVSAGRPKNASGPMSGAGQAPHWKRWEPVGHGICKTGMPNSDARTVDLTYTSRTPRLYLERICRRIGTAHDRMDGAGITRGGQHRFSTGSGNDGKQPAPIGQSRHENGPPDSSAGRPVHIKKNPRSPRSTPQQTYLSNCRAITIRCIWLVPS